MMPQQLSSNQMVFSLKMLSPFTYYVEAEEAWQTTLFLSSCASLLEISKTIQMARVSERACRILQKVARLVSLKVSNGLEERFAKWTTITNTDSALLKPHDENGQASLYQLPNQEGDERILENHLTSDILLTLPGQALRRFANHTEFVKAF